MDILFQDGTKRSVKFNAEFAAQAIRKAWRGEAGYRIQLNQNHDRKTLLKQKNDIEHYIEQYDLRDLKSGKR